MRPQRRRALIEGTLVESPADTQRAVAEALQALGAATGEMPDSQWQWPEPVGDAAAAELRTCAHAQEHGQVSAREGR
jgi:hypothetical protein